jgi:long-chain fatty acid transport protein
MCAKNLSVLATLGFIPVSSFALGIRLFDHDAFATARGNAYVATADNASAVYYNPAGISQLKGHNTRAAFSLVNADSDVDSRTGGGSSLQDEWVFLPGFFYSYGSSNAPFSVGVGYFLPFGFSTEWPDQNPFRNTIVSGDLQYHTVSSVVSWQITETLSLAAGPTLNYARAEVRKGMVTYPDEFKFEGDGFDFGVSAGVLWQPLARHAFGLKYRSATKIELEGKSTSQPLSSMSARQDASTELPFPHVLTLGYAYKPTPRWNIEVDFDWTDGERVNRPVVKQGTGNLTLPLQWESSYAIQAGATHYLDNGLRVSAGYAYVEQSIPERTFTPLIPEQDLHVFSAGLGGAYKRFTWDATYQFTYGPQHDVGGSTYGPQVDGNYDFTAHAFSLSFGYTF